MARPKTMETRKLVSFPLGMTAQIDEFRFGNRFKTESDAVRALISKGLEAYRKEAEGQTEGGVPA
ncbi:MAG: hypothetical protein AB1744_02920 [Candidatus Zixiibacteriota bacterium]